MTRYGTLTAALVLWLYAGALAANPPAAEFRDGRWQPIESAAPAPPPTDPQLDRVEQMLSAGQNTEALKLDLLWIKTHDRKAPLRDRAVFLLAQANYAIDDRIKAYYFCDEVMDEYPESKLFYPALQLQFKIADEFLSGHKMRFLGMPIVSAEDEAVEMLYRIQQRSPGSPLAEKALLRTADYYYSDRDYDLAHDAYESYIKYYPRSPMAPTVKLRSSFSLLAQFNGIPFDPTPVVDARAKLVDIEAAYPELAQEENIAAIVNAIDETLSAKLYAAADFYRRTHEPFGAVYMYRYLILTYPDASQVPAARKALSQMPKWALDQPDPRPGSQYQYLPGKEPS